MDRKLSSAHYISPRRDHDAIAPKLIVNVEYLSAVSAAQFLGISTKTLANARVAGTSPPYAKVFGRIRYEMSDLVHYVLARRRFSTSHGGERDAL